MVISDQVQDRLNKQINMELASSYIYYSMAAYFTSVDLNGFAKWMRVQAKEEQAHADRLFDYIVERGGRVKLDAIEKPAESWESALNAFEVAYAHECKVTESIADCVKVARDAGDLATEQMLAWFVNEQVEEEASAQEMVAYLKMAANSVGAQMQLDRAAGKRGS